MAKDITTIRLQPALRKVILREAKKLGLSFSDIVQMLLQAFAEHTIHIGVTQYPKGFIEKIGREADAVRVANRKGRVRRYHSAKELFDELLHRL